MSQFSRISFQDNNCFFDLARWKNSSLFCYVLMYPQSFYNSLDEHFAQLVHEHKATSRSTNKLQLFKCVVGFVMAVISLQKPSDIHKVESCSHQVILREWTLLLTLPAWDLSLCWTLSTWTCHQASGPAEPPEVPKKDKYLLVTAC